MFSFNRFLYFQVFIFLFWFMCDFNIMLVLTRRLFKVFFAHKLRAILCHHILTFVSALLICKGHRLALAMRRPPCWFLGRSCVCILANVDPLEEM